MKSFGVGEKVFFTRMAEFGFRPETIYDVGAASGSWSAEMADVFPDAVFHLFEPLTGRHAPYERSMTAVLSAHPRFALHPIAVGNETGTVTMNLTSDGVSSSIHPMDPATVVPIQVPVWRLDEYVAKHGLPPPKMIKMDVQGFEAFALEGCGALLEKADALFLETWLVRGYGPNTPLLTELIAALAPLDFVLLDLSGPYHDEGQQLAAVDAVFLSRRLLAQIKQPSRAWQW